VIKPLEAKLEKVIGKQLEFDETAEENETPPM